MVLKLSLPEDRFIWALSHPVGKGYIHHNDGTGYQECKLIISQADNQPVEIDLENYPKWAQSMIKNSIRAGELINDGDPIDESKRETKQEELVEDTKVEETEDVTEVKKPVKKTTRRRQTRKKKDE